MKDAARACRSRRCVQLRRRRLDPQRVLTNELSPELVDGASQSAGQRAAEIGDADTDDPVVRLYFQRDDRTGAARVFGSAGERLVSRQRHDLRTYAGYLHWGTLGGMVG